MSRIFVLGILSFFIAYQVSYGSERETGVLVADSIWDITRIYSSNNTTYQNSTTYQNNSTYQNDYSSEKKSKKTKKKKTSSVKPKSYIYPEKVDDFNLIYSKLNAARGDEFTSTKEYNKNIEPIVKEIMKNKDSLVFKKKKIWNNEREFRYDPDKESLTVFLSENHPERIFLDERESQFHGKWTEYVLTEQEIEKSSSMIGKTAMGVEFEFISDQGNGCGLLMTHNKKVIAPYWTYDFSKISPEDARSLKNNMEVFYIGKLVIYKKHRLTYKSGRGGKAALDSPYQYKFSDKVIALDVEAILICNKSTKKVFKVIEKFKSPIY